MYTVRPNLKNKHKNPNSSELHYQLVEAGVSKCELCTDLLCRKPVSRVGKRETVALNAHQEAAKYPGPEMESRKPSNAVLLSSTAVLSLGL